MATVEESRFLHVVPSALRDICDELKSLNENLKLMISLKQMELENKIKGGNQ